MNKIKNKRIILAVTGIFLILVFALYGVISFIRYFTSTYDIVFPIQEKIVRLDYQKAIKSQGLKIDAPQPTTAPQGMIPVAHAEAPVAILVPSLGSQELKDLVLSYFPINERGAVDELIRRESTWNPYAINPSSQACGLGQALPCSKMGCETLSDIKCQASWLEAYIRGRYVTANNALAFHTAHGYY